jgi:hypothetical protein
VIWPEVMEAFEESVARNRELLKLLAKGNLDHDA